jgi:putative membrane protein
MRWVLRLFFYYLFSLFLLARFTTFVHIRTDAALISAAFVLMLLNTLGKPLIKVLWLPINLVTLGLFSWMVNVIVVFLATLAVPAFSLTPFASPAIRIGLLLFPAIHLTILWTYLFFALVLSIARGIFGWIFA